MDEMGVMFWGGRWVSSGWHGELEELMRWLGRAVTRAKPAVLATTMTRVPALDILVPSGTCSSSFLAR
jgi:hypothetical protein